MQVQNSPTKKSFKIDDLAKELGLKKFVIKNWEKQFDLKKSGNDNKYSHEDYKIFVTIKDLVFNQKLSHSIAKKRLQDILEGKEVVSATQATATEQAAEPMISAANVTAEQINETEQMPKSVLDFILAGQSELSLTHDQAAAQDPAPEQVAEQAAPEFAAAPVQETAQEPAQEIVTAQEVVAQKPENLPETYQAAQETENMAATASQDITQINPAFKEKEEFLKSLRSFKEQLLAVHAQLK